MTSASITRSSDLLRSWLRSRRTVSWLVSMSSAPPATKPATRTRWNGDTSSLAGIGVSTGTSYIDAPQPAAAAQTNVRPTSASLAFVLLLSHAVIDFLEQIVILPDLGVVRIEL